MVIGNSRQKYVCSYNNASLVSISNGFLIFFLLKKHIYIYTYLPTYPLVFEFA